MRPVGEVQVRVALSGLRWMVQPAWCLKPWWRRQRACRTWSGVLDGAEVDWGGEWIGNGQPRVYGGGYTEYVAQSGHEAPGVDVKR